ncbi:MAG: DUF1697 domain-containing protein [Lutibacter sp.]
MATYIALLRGINVSGKHQIKMTDLKTLCKKIGFLNTQSYIQSGNLIFEHPSKKTDELENILHQAILKEFNFKIPVFIFGRKEFSEIINNNPLFKITENTKSMYFCFLKTEPAKENIESLITLCKLGEVYFHYSKTLYLNYPNGLGKSKLHNTAIERKLQTITTTRNFNTVNKLVKLSELL